MKRRGKIGALLLVLSLAAGGCGETPITLTPEEEAAIVTYAAHVVSKFNTRQPDGLSHVSESLYEKKTQDQTKQPATETEGETEGETGQPDTEADTDKKKPEGGNDSQGTQEGNRTVELSEALGLKGISAECTGAELKVTYVEPDDYSLDAPEGSTFLVLHIKLTNETAEDIACDLLTERLSYVALVNDTVRAKARTTILLNDLGTYQETVKAGQSADTVLLFEVPADKVTAVESVKLTIEKDGTKKESIL